MQAKCTNFDLCSLELSTNVRLKVPAEFPGVFSDNSLEQTGDISSKTARNFVEIRLQYLCTILYLLTGGVRYRRLDDVIR